MKALIDGDILLYEIGFGSESGWRAITDTEDLPSWEYVVNLLHLRLDEILHKTGADSYQIYVTEGKTFRYDLATVKPYKGTRKENKPWHYANLKAYMLGSLGAEAVTYIEADDRLSVEHIADGNTVLVSRDKDLRQVPGLFYSWELGRQPEFGPELITQEGSLSLDKGKLTGTGFAFFCAQVLMGDPTDNIPGLPKCGPVKAYEVLNDSAEPTAELIGMYSTVYGLEGPERLLEQGQLCWMTRKLNPDGTPVLWEIGQTE